MGVNLSGRSFLKLLDLTTEEIEYLLKLSKNFKDMKRAGVPHRYLEGKNIVLLFQKTSTRTRCAFEVGGMDLGMGVTYLDPGSSQMGKKESIEDTARVLGRMYDGIEFRGFAQDDVEELAAKSGVPVWNGLTTEWHPTQMLADILLRHLSNFTDFNVLERDPRVHLFYTNNVDELAKADVIHIVGIEQKIGRAHV